MPHVALVPFTGFRVREEEMLALGMSLPGLKRRALDRKGEPGFVESRSQLNTSKTRRQWRY